MHPVADFNQNDPDILGHGHEHFPQILHLLLFCGGIFDLVELGHTLHQVCYRDAEALGNLLMGGVGVLNGVVEQGGDDGVGVQPQVRHQVGHLQGMGDVGGAVLAELTVMVLLGIGIGVPHPVLLLRGHILYFFFQLGKPSGQLVLHRDLIPGRILHSVLPFLLLFWLSGASLFAPGNVL